MRILRLFPDTNFFIQCKAPQELDWSIWSEFDEIRLIITRPVQREIDAHKNKGGDRVARRAREAASLIRSLIFDGDKVVRAADPRVVFTLQAGLKADPSLAEQLDYYEPDDQLVGIIHAYRQHNPDADVRIFTQDTGPMASANMIGLPIFEIPEAWRRPPEPSESDKRIRQLEAEVSRLKTDRPDFEVRFGPDDQDLASLNGTITEYVALTDGEVQGLIERIKEACPISTDFGPAEPEQRTGRSQAFPFGRVTESFTPATEDEKIAYRDEHYPEWLDKCRAFLASYHQTLHSNSEPMRYCIRASNTGARPARDALITINSMGNFRVRPTDGPDASAPKKDKKPDDLPSPPAVPRGSWASKSFANYASIVRDIAGRDVFGQHVPDLSRHLFRDAEARDPNGFYYKPSRPRMLVSVYSLECDQWRHGNEPELFWGIIAWDRGQDDIKGALECRVEADNLSDPITKLLPVRIQIVRVSAFSAAEQIVESFVRRRTRFKGMGL